MGLFFFFFYMYQYMAEAGMAEHKQLLCNQMSLSALDYRTIIILNNICNKEGLQTSKPMQHSSSKTFLKKQQDHDPSARNSHTSAS